MKNGLLFLTCILFAATLSAQTAAAIQTGLVREQNSNKKPVAGAQIIFTDAVPATSDQSGKFRLAFSGKKPGDLIFYQEISKKGYEIVNEKELQILKIGGSNNLGKDIILAKAGTLDAAKKEYYDISDKALSASFNKEKNALQAKLKAAQLTQQNYLDQFNALSEQYEQQQKALDVLADVFARTNFDDVSADYKKSFELFEGGKIEEALKILEGVDLIGRTKNRLKEKKRLETAETAVARQKLENEQEIKEDLQGLQLQAQLYVLTFQVEKAERLYDQIVYIDSTNIDLLQESANFYSQQFIYNKAVNTLNKLVNNPAIEPWQKVEAILERGEMYMGLSKYDFAIEDYKKCQKECNEMIEKERFKKYFQHKLGAVYAHLGSIYCMVGDFDLALKYYNDDYILHNYLYNLNPRNFYAIIDLAISAQLMGDLYRQLRNQDSAMVYYVKYNQLSNIVFEYYPNNFEYKQGVAVSLEKIGLLETANGRLEDALSKLMKSNLLFSQLHDSIPSNPQNLHFLAHSYQVVGLNLMHQNKIEKATYYFEEFYRLEKSLSEKYPQNLDYKESYALSCANLAKNLPMLGEGSERTLMLFRQFNSITEDLLLRSPENINYKINLLTSNLGAAYIVMGKIDSALNFYERYHKYSKVFSATYPENPEFSKYLLFSYDMLSKLYFEEAEKQRKAYYYRLCIGLDNNTYDNNSDLFNKRVAVSYERLGDIYVKSQLYDTACVFYKAETKIFECLFKKDITDLDLKNSLALSYERLGDVNLLLNRVQDAIYFYEIDMRFSRDLLGSIPQEIAYKEKLAIALQKLAIATHFIEEPKSLSSLKESEMIYNELLEINPDNKKYINNLNIIREDLKSLESAEISNYFKAKIENAPNPKLKYQIYTEFCDSLRNASVNNPKLKIELADAINSRAWLGFFLQKFEDVEAGIREGMALETDNKYLPTNLAPALLFQGKYQEALSEYNKWKDQPFNAQDLPTYRDAFLDDLSAFEKAGIVPEERKPDVATVRKLLSER